MKRSALQRWIPFRLALIVATLNAAWPQRAQAANGDWNIVGGGSWATYGNWTPAGPPVPGSTAGDVINFTTNPTASNTVTLDGNRTVGTLNISPATAAAALTLAGNGTGGYLVFDNGAGTAALNFTNAAGTAGHAIYAPVVLNSNLEISATNASTHSLLGGITGSGSVTVDSNGAHPAGTNNFIGQVAFGGVNSYSGGTTVTEARLETRSNWALGTGKVTVNNGGGIGIFSGGYFKNNFDLTGLGWNESANGGLGAIRTEGTTVFNGTLNMVATGAAPMVRLSANNAAATLLYNGVLTGGADIEFGSTTGAGAAVTHIVNTTNTSTGAMVINAVGTTAGSAVLQVGNNNASGALGAGNITIGTRGTLAFNRQDNISVANSILAGTGGISQLGLGQTTLTSGSILNTGVTTVSGLQSRLIFNPGGTGGALTLAATPGNIALSNWADVEFNTSSNLNLSGTVTGSRGNYLIQSGSGTTTLSGAADNGGGRAIVNAGTLELAKTSTAAVHALGGGGDFGLIINGGTARIGNTTGDQIVDGGMVRVNGGAFDLNGANETIGTLSGAAGSVTSAGAATLTINSTAGVLGTFFNGTVGTSALYRSEYGGTGVISGNVALTKSGAGLQILTGTHTYTGATNVTAGTLAVNATTATAGTVAADGGTLAGTGFVGQVTMSATAGSTIAPGLTGLANDAAATLTMDSLTVNGGTMALNIGATSDQVAVTNALTLAAASTVTPIFTAAPGTGPVTIVTSAGITAGPVIPTLTGVPATTRGVFSVAQNGNNLELQNTVASKNLTWSGGTTAWDLNTTANWNAGADTFFNLDAVTFNGTAPGNVVLAAGLHPSAITVNAAAGSDYNFTTGTIVGNAGITKSNTGNLTISTANTFTGDVNITGGTLITANGAALGSTAGQTYVSGGGTLDVNGQNLGAEIINIAGTGVGGAGALINSGVSQINAVQNLRLTADATVGGTVGAPGTARFDVRGTGVNLDLGGFTLTKTGNNQFSIVGANVTSGNIVHNSGLMGIETTSVVQGTGLITVNSGAQLMFYQSVGANITRPITLNDGAIVHHEAQNSAANSPVTLNGAVTLQGTANTMTWGGAFSESGASSITKNQGGTHLLSSNVSYTGNTTVNQGTLTLGGTAFGANTITTPGAATLGTGGALDAHNGGTQGNLAFGNGGYTTIGGGGPASITINNGTLSVNSRSNNTLSGAIVTNYGGGTNAISLTGAEQFTELTLGGAVGSSTKWGTMSVIGGNVNVGASSPMNLRFIDVNSITANSTGANVGILNITGGTHNVGGIYLGNGTNLAGMMNMSGGTLNIVANGEATLQSTNNSGYALWGTSGLRIGHFGNGATPGSIFNLSGGTVDASKSTVSVGWDGAGFLNITGGTLKARTLYIDNNGLENFPITNRMDISGGARLELGYGGIPSDGTNTAINSGNSTWVGVESSDWTRGISLNATGAAATNVDTLTNRVNITGALAGNGNLSRTGNGILQLSGANVSTGSIANNAGTLRMGNAQALADGSVAIASGATLDVNGSNGAGIAVRPSSITIGGGTGAAGSLGSLINSSGTTGGIGTDAGGTITFSSSITSYANGRLELGGGTDSTIVAGTNSFTKNGQGNVVWRGTGASTVGNIILNGGTFYAENSVNNLGSTGSVIVNSGAILSTFNANTQSKPVILAGGSVFGDTTVNHTWTGGLSLTADSLQTRGGIGTVTFDNASLDLGGFTLTKRDRGTLAFQNNTASGNGNLNIIAGSVNLVNSTFDGTGTIKVGGDANLSLDATSSVTKSIMLAGGLVGDATATSRTLTVDSTGNGGIGALNPGATIGLGNLKVLGSTAYSKTAGLMIGSGNGFTDSATAGVSVGTVTLTNTGILLNNPNFTVSSNPSAAINDTTFARWDGTKVTGVAPTSGNINTATATDVVMQTVAPGAAITVDQTIGSLITDVGVTITGATLKLNDGGIIVREAGGAGWSGTGFLTSGRPDGVLALTTANGFDQTLPLGGANVGAFTIGNISNNPISATPAAFRPVTLVKNGTGNIPAVANQAYTGGTIINGGRVNMNAQNGFGLGNVTVREGGTVLFSTGGGFSNNFNAAGVGLGENAGVLGALRLSASAAVAGTTTLNGLTRLHTHGSDVGIVLGNISGTAADSLEKTGSGNLIIRSAATYTGATIVGNAGGNLSNGTLTAFNLANGGTASSIGASSNAASNLMFHSGTINYIGGGASTDRLFTIAAPLANSATGVASAIGIANNGYGNLNFTNTGTIATQGSNDATLTLTANNFTANTLTPSLVNPSGARLNVSVNGPGSWTLNGSSYGINGTVALSGGADLILDTQANVTIPVLTGALQSYLVKNNNNTLTLGGSSPLADADNNTAQLIVNAGTVIFDKRGANGFGAGQVAGPGTNGAKAIGGGNLDGLVLNGGTVRYASTANADQIADTTDVRINGGTLDLNGRQDSFDALNGAGGKITNGSAGTLSQLALGAGNSQSLFQFAGRASYGGNIEDGVGQIELIKIGNGVQVLSGTNTYTGKTAVENGFLSIDSEARLGSNPAAFSETHLLLDSPGVTGGGGLETTATFAIDDANRGVWLNNNDVGMRPAAGTTLTLATTLRGPGGIQTVGEGGVTLSGANLNTGNTAVYRGTLTLDYSTQNNSKLANGGALIFRGGKLDLSGGSHTEVVGSATVDGNGNNAGASYLSRSSGTSVINLNAINRAAGTIGGTIDIDAAGIATTDSNNVNGIIAGATTQGNNGMAFLTVGKTNWATSVATGAVDTPINAFSAYTVNTLAAANHVDVTPAIPAIAAAATATASTLRFNNAGATAVTGGAGSTLRLNQQGILMTSAAGATTISVPTLTGFANQTTPTANTTFNTDLIVHQHSANDLTISSVIANTVVTSGAFTNTNVTGLTKVGAGKLILSGANTYTGTTHINEGALELQGSAVLGNNVAGNAVWVDGTLSLNRSGNYTIANNMGGGAGGIIYKTNTGIATLSGGIGTYAGGAVVSQGTLLTTGDAFGNPNPINDNPAINSVFGTIILGDASTGANNVAYLDGRAAAHTIRKDIIVTNTGSTGTAVIGSSTAKAGNNTIHLGNVQMNRTTILRGDGNDRLTFSGVLSGNVGTLTIDAPNVAAVAINTNPGRVTLENNNTFVGNVVVNGAILQVGSGNIGDPRDQIPDTSNVTLTGVSATKQAGLTLNGDSETINNLNGDANSFIQSAASSSATGMRLTVNGTGIFSGVFHGGNNTGMTLEKAGSGMFTLAGGADNNTGRVLVSSGTLQFAKASNSGVHAIGADSVIQGGTLLLGGTGGDQIFDNVALTMYGGAFDLGGTNETLASIFSNTGTGTITNSGATASTLTLGGNNSSSLLGAVIENGTGGMGLGKIGTGGAVLTGANTYTGTTNITGGFIQIGNGGTTGSLSASSAVTLASNTQLVFNRSNNISFPNTISGTGGLVQNGSGVLEIPIGSVNTYTGPTVVNDGELNVDGSIADSAVTLNPGTTLSGSGTVGPVGSRGGIIAPGNSAGILTTSSVIVDADSVFEFEVNGLGAGSGHDQINTTGLIDITNSTLVLSVSFPSVAAGDKVFLWLNDSTDAISGNWLGLPEGATIPYGMGQWTLSYNDDSAGNPTGLSNGLGNDVSLYFVPEPSAALLAGAAALLAAGRRRRVA